ncbi:TPA: hypothetical protein NV716_002915 [Escherichia coli]|nr:hypothetical protein [Escherichia coli]HBB3920623.1 hypothetical protein [Escherichia coli]HCJ8588738.1 hypothetical protein [Escherichia coli]
MKILLSFLAFSLLTACTTKADTTPKKQDTVILTKCGAFNISKKPQTDISHQWSIWINGIEFDGINGIEAGGELSNGMHAHTYVFVVGNKRVPDDSYDIALLAATGGNVWLRRSLGENFVDQDKCDISESALKAIMHNKRLKY